MLDLHEPCVVCGRPAAPHGEHHFRDTGDMASGKQMGGTHDHLETVVVCRPHHEQLHERRITLSIRDGKYVTELGDGNTVTRPLSLSPDETDEALAERWAQAQSMGVDAIIMQAAITAKFRQRYGGFDHWWVRVADIIRTHTGLKVSVGMVYDRAALAIAIEASGRDPKDMLEELGVKSLAAAGRAISKGQDAEAVIDRALELRENNSRHALADLIKQEFIAGDDSIPADIQCQEHTCRVCAAKWRDPGATTS